MAKSFLHVDLNETPERLQIMANFFTLLANSQGGGVNLLDGLVAYWKLSNLNDATGRGNGLGNNNSSTFVAGKIGDAVNLASASEQYLWRASTTDLQLGGTSFHVWLWFKHTTFVAGAPILCKGADNQEWGIQVRNDPNGIAFMISSGPILKVPFTPDTNWHCVQFWYDADADLIYGQVDGGTVVSDTPILPIVNDAGLFYIGGDPANGFFNGLIDEAGIRKVIATPSERAAVYNSGSGVTYPFE